MNRRSEIGRGKGPVVRGADDDALLETLGNPVLVTDRDGVITLWNAALERLLGWTAAERIGQVVGLALDPREIAARAAELSEKLGRPFEPGVEVLLATARSGEPETRDWTVAAKDGRRLSLTMTMTALRDSDGSVRGFVAVGSDSTERTEARAQLAREGALRKALINASGASIVAYDRNGVVTVWNPAAERMLGWTAEERIGRIVGSSVDPQQLAARAAELSEELGRPVEPGLAVFAAKVRSGEPETRDWTYIAKDGRRGTMTLTVSAVTAPDGKIEGFVSVGGDTTDLREAQAALAREAAFREELIASAGDLIVAYDRNGVITVWNPAAERMLGWTAEEKIGNVLGRAADPEEIAARAAELSEELGRTIEPGPAVFVAKVRAGQPETREWTYIAKDGSRIPVLQTVSQIRSRGKVIGFICLARDISEIRAARDELHVREKQALADAHDLRILNAELERSNRELEQFARVVAHDLKDPLRAISGTVNMLRQRNAEAFDETSMELVGLATDGVARMGRFIETLLDYSRLGRSGRSPGPVDCATALADALANLAASIEESGAVVTHGELPAVIADSREIVSLFQNIVGNAVKYRSAATPVIRVEARPGDAAGTTEIRVTDNGIGIAAEARERVFDLFVRLDAGSTRSGTGVGLAICRKIVDQAGGRIWTEPAEPSGTTVAFTLPTAPG